LKNKFTEQTCYRGWYFDKAMDYVVQKGVVEEKDYPYANYPFSYAPETKFPSYPCLSQYYRVAARCTGYEKLNITDYGANSEIDTEALTNELAIKEIVATSKINSC
jgi:hypothetical protein